MIIVIIWSVLSFKFIDGLVLTVYCVKRYAYKTLKSASIKGSGLKAETLQNVEISFSLVCHWPRVYRVSIIICHEFTLLLGLQSLHQLY